MSNCTFHCKCLPVTAADDLGLGSKHDLFTVCSGDHAHVTWLIACCDMPCIKKKVQPTTQHHPCSHRSLVWSSSLQHMTVKEGQGWKVRWENCPVTCCHVTMKDEWENTGCCYSVWWVVVFFRAGSHRPYGVMWCWYAAESKRRGQRWSRGMLCCDITGLLLLKRLACVWPPAKPSMDAKKC